MTATQAPAGADRSGAGTDAGTLTIRITTAGVTDREVAAITVALMSTATGAPPSATDGPPAWRQAGLLEAAADRRVRTPAQLRHPA